MDAIANDDVAQVEALLRDPGVDVNWRGPRSGANALTAAASDGRLAIVELLLGRGANPNIATDENTTPLQLASYRAYTDVMQLLIDVGADVNAAETRYGMTPLARAARNGHIQAIKLLLDAGADRRARTKNGRDARQVALQYGHFEAADVLLRYQPSAPRSGTALQ